MSVVKFCKKPVKKSAALSQSAHGKRAVQVRQTRKKSPKQRKSYSEYLALSNAPKPYPCASYQRMLEVDRKLSEILENQALILRKLDVLSLAAFGGQEKAMEVIRKDTEATRHFVEHLVEDAMDSKPFVYPQAAQDEARRYGEVCSSSDSVNYTTPVAEIAGRGLDEVQELAPAARQYWRDIDRRNRM